MGAESHRPAARMTLLRLLDVISALGLLVIASTIAKAQDYSPDGLPMAHPLVIAQGGSRGDYPLYTIQAYQKALSNGVRNLECKVCFTKEAEAVCCPGLSVEYISTVKKYHTREHAHTYTPFLHLNPQEPPETGFFIFNMTNQQLDMLIITVDERHPKTVVDGRRPLPFKWPPRAKLAKVEELLTLALNWTPPPNASPSEQMDKDQSDSTVDPAANSIRVILEPLYAQFMADQVGIYPEKVLCDILERLNLVPQQQQQQTEQQQTEESPVEKPEDKAVDEGVPPKVAVHIQSKEISFLRSVREYAPGIPLIMVLDTDWDRKDASFPILNQTGGYARWFQAAWQEVSSLVWAVAVSKDLLLPRDSSNHLVVNQELTKDHFRDGTLQEDEGQIVTDVAAAARMHHLALLTWSFCQFVPKPMAFDFSEDIYSEYEAFVQGVGVDGLFTSCPKTFIRFSELKQEVAEFKSGWQELVVLASLVVLAMLPMGLGLLYTIYKWRESERLRQWQEFNEGTFALVPRPSNQRSGAAGQPRPGLGLGMLGTSAHRGFEQVPLTEEEFEGSSTNGVHSRLGDEEQQQAKESLLDEGPTSSGPVLPKKGSAGTWRMRRGAEWNSDEAWS